MSAAVVIVISVSYFLYNIPHLSLSERHIIIETYYYAFANMHTHIYLKRAATLSVSVGIKLKIMTRLLSLDAAS